MTDRVTADAAVWISTLISQFPELADELVPGRRGGAPQPADTLGQLSAQQRERAALRREEERRDALLVQQRHGLAVPGHSAAPLRLHVSDAIRDVTDGVVELDEAVHAKLRLPRPRRADVPRRLHRIAGLLGEIAAHPVLARHVRDETRRMARRVARALGDTETLVRLPGRCPWCDSVSLRSAPAHATVLCVNPACRCDTPTCGCHDDPAYRHVWPQSVWDTLRPKAAEDADAPRDAGARRVADATRDADAPRGAGAAAGARGGAAAGRDDVEGAA